MLKNMAQTMYSHRHACAYQCEAMQAAINGTTCAPDYRSPEATRSPVKSSQNHLSQRFSLRYSTVQRSAQHMLRDTRRKTQQLRNICATPSLDSSLPETGRRKIVFLGTPEVAADVLRQLVAASQLPLATFEVAAVVTQPGKPRGRKQLAQPSPVEEAAKQLAFDSACIWTPLKARDDEFLQQLRQLSPDLCVTAAYGNILPQAFLDIPRYGTLNIHPSLLPRWRGAAPVPRSLQAGETESGVSVAFTVRAMDAGPIAAQVAVEIPIETNAPELLNQLFDHGAKLLIDMLPSVWSGAAALNARDQDSSLVTHAAKMSKAEAALDLSRSAMELHNTIRAFSGWPGSTVRIRFSDEDGHLSEAATVKVLETRPPTPEAKCSNSPGDVLSIPCGPDMSDNLEVLRLQPENKKPMSVKDFKNGFVKGRRLTFNEC